MARLLIPTRNRPTSLMSVIAFLERFHPGTRVIVADGSADSYAHENRIAMLAGISLDQEFGCGHGLLLRARRRKRQLGHMDLHVFLHSARHRKVEAGNRLVKTLIDRHIVAADKVERAQGIVRAVPDRHVAVDGGACHQTELGMKAGHHDGYGVVRTSINI